MPIRFSRERDRIFRRYKGRESCPAQYVHAITKSIPDGMKRSLEIQAEQWREGREIGEYNEYNNSEEPQ